MNSGPLSTRRYEGYPRPAATASSTRITRSAGNEKSISSARASRENRSSSVNTRNPRPVASASRRKSIAHQWFLLVGAQLLLAPPHGQPRRTIHAIDPFQIHPHALASYQDRQSSVAPSTPHRGEGDQPIAQRVISRPPRSIPHHGR